MALLETTTANGNRRQTDHDYGMGYSFRGHNAQNKLRKMYHKREIADGAPKAIFPIIIVDRKGVIFYQKYLHKGKFRLTLHFECIGIIV